MEYSDALVARTFVYDGGQCCNSIARHHDRGMIYAGQAIFVTAFYSPDVRTTRREGGSGYLLFWKQRLLISRNRSGGKLKAYSVHGRAEDDSCHQDSQKQSGRIRQK